MLFVWTEETKQIRKNVKVNGSIPEFCVITFIISELIHARANSLFIFVSSKVGAKGIK